MTAPLRRLEIPGLWCPETVNEVLDVDDRHVAVAGHTRLFVWSHADAALVFAAAIDRRGPGPGRLAGELRSGALLFRRRDESWCRVELATGAVTELAAPPEIGPRHFDANVEDRRLVVRDRRGHPIAAVPWGGRFAQARVSSDGRWLAAAQLGSRVHLFDRGRERFEGLAAPPSSLSFAADGSRLVACTAGSGGWQWPLGGGAGAPIPLSGRVAIAGSRCAGLVATGTERRLVRLDAPDRSVVLDGWPESLSFSTDAGRAAITTATYGGLGIWPSDDVVVADLDRGVELLRFATRDNFIPMAALSGDGRLLAVTDAGRTILYPVPDQPARGRPQAIADWPLATPHIAGRRLLLAGDKLQIADLDSHEIAGEAEDVVDATELAMSADGRFVLARGDGELRILGPDLATLAAFEVPGRIGPVAASPDGALIATADGAAVLLWRNPGLS